MCNAVAVHESSGPAFAAYLKAIQVWRCHVNNHLRMRLQQIYRLPGYRGPLPPSAAALSSSVPASNGELFSTAL